MEKKGRKEWRAKDRKLIFSFETDAEGIGNERCAFAVGCLAASYEKQISRLARELTARYEADPGEDKRTRTLPYVSFLRFKEESSLGKTRLSARFTVTKGGKRIFEHVDLFSGEEIPFQTRPANNSEKKKKMADKRIKNKKTIAK